MGTLRGGSGQIAEILKRRSIIDICCMQETLLVQSLKMVKGKSAQYEWFGTEDDKGLGGLDI